MLLGAFSVFLKTNTKCLFTNSHVTYLFLFSTNENAAGLAMRWSGINSNMFTGRTCFPQSFPVHMARGSR